MTESLEFMTMAKSGFLPRLSPNLTRLVLLSSISSESSQTRSKVPNREFNFLYIFIATQNHLLFSLSSRLAPLSRTSPHAETAQEINLLVPANISR